MSFFIFCPKHRNIAVCDNIDNYRELSIGLPYIYLSPDYNKRMTAEDGICLILSDGDSRLFAKYKEQKPFDTNVLKVWALHLKQTKFGFTRLTCYVRLHCDNPVLHCCRKTSRIIWLNAEYFPKDFTDILRNPMKVRTHKDIQNLLNDSRIYFEFYSVLLPEFISNYSINYEPEYDEQDVLKSLIITEKQTEMFSIDFTEHCFPSMVMTFHSFKTYLKKYGFICCEKYLQRLFYGFGQYSGRYSTNILIEGELLIGLAFLDIECPSYKCRLKFVSVIMTSIETDI